MSAKKKTKKKKKKKKKKIGRSEKTETPQLKTRKRPIPHSPLPLHDVC